jgi:Tfp pilus assembly protein PilV
MKKIPKGMAMLEVMIGAALVVIVIAIFLSMQAGGNKQSKTTSLNQDVGLYLNHVLETSDSDYSQVNNGLQTYTYTSPSNNTLGDYAGGNDFMQSLSTQGVQSITVTVESQRDEDAE